MANPTAAPEVPSKVLDPAEKLKSPATLTAGGSAINVEEYCRWVGESSDDSTDDGMSHRSRAPTVSCRSGSNT